MNINNLRTELSHRLSLHINDDFGLEESWKNLTNILSENINETIAFFKNVCTDEEFFWLSEVFSDVAEKTHSNDFVLTLKQRLAQITRDNYAQNNFKNEQIKTFIDYDEYIKSVQLEIDYAESALVSIVD